MSQLGEMGEQLQSCQSIEEAYAISAQYIQELFPADQGAIYLLSPARDLAEAVEMWGDATSMEKMFVPSNCWAIRRGRPHLVDDSHPGLQCGHITGSQAGQNLCVPMIAHGEVLGILYLSHPAPEQDQQQTTDRLYSEHKTQLALTVTDHIALTLSNLKLQEELRHQAIRDILTGLFNRRYMEESLRRELNQAEREGTSVGVIIFDFDHFKDLNDFSGHDGGDALLRELGGFLVKSTRGGDIVSRYGGDEFVVVLPGATLEETRLRAEELRQGVGELVVFHLGKPLSKCTLSLGVAAFPENGVTSDEIFKSADTALYRAKNEGRDRVVVASTIS
jgi:diguanylate cyclase (GGDEF)-like protein